MQIGGALGVAVLGTALAIRYTNVMTPLLANRHIPAGINSLILGSLGGALAVAQRFPARSASSWPTRRGIASSLVWTSDSSSPLWWWAWPAWSSWPSSPTGLAPQLPPPRSWTGEAVRERWFASRLKTEAARPNQKLSFSNPFRVTMAPRVGAAPQGTRRTQFHENHHLAKVRAAGSDPVFRSIGAGQGRVLALALIRAECLEAPSFGVRCPLANHVKSELVQRF
jgi:hypothetical protein